MTQGLWTSFGSFAQVVRYRIDPDFKSFLYTQPLFLKLLQSYTYLLIWMTLSIRECKSPLTLVMVVTSGPVYFYSCVPFDSPSPVSQYLLWSSYIVVYSVAPLTEFNLLQ